METINAQIRALVFDGDARAWRREQFLTLGDAPSVDAALRALERERRLAKIADGRYVPLRDGALAVAERHYQVHPGELASLPKPLRRSWSTIVRRYGSPMKILSEL